ncbi:PQQ-dependent dehydrogenase [Agrobacterium tumefaciens str. Cherry 2E-2-2]|nr:PQQ-dependent dehydrogenase [Agrobacterium tumefaciens str. Cherry 2E-2-2]
MVSLQSLSSIFQMTKQRWATEVGAFHYRNNFVRKANCIVASTSGSIWNAGDPMDGVCCLDAISGEIMWRFHTRGDANGILEHNNIIVGGTDSGQIFALDVETGALLAQYQSETAVYTTPLLIQQDQGDVLVSVSHGGEIIVYRPGEAIFESFGFVRGKFRASPATSASLAAVGTFILASEDGEILKVTLRGAEVDLRSLHQLQDAPTPYGAAYIVAVRGIGSLLVSKNRVFVSYVRDTYDKHPPLCCIDVDTGEKIWDAKAVKTLSKKRSDYGNARTLPIIYNDLLISTFGYNDSVHAFSLSTGRGVWMVRLDEGLLQNWASPIISSTGRLFVPRVNGIIHEVDILRQKVVNSISVEIGRYVNKDGYNLREKQFGEDRWEGTNPITHESKRDKMGPYPDEVLVSGLAASPIVFDDTLIVGGVSGSLRAYRI